MASEKRLGMGLGALLGNPSSKKKAPVAAKTKTRAAEPVNTPQEIAIDELRPNPYQPRKTFAEEEIRTLSASIKKSGVLQPVLVRRVNGRFEIVAGERRCRAAREAGLEKVPVVIRDVKDDEMLTLALVENIQRHDLNPMEKARAFQQLMSLREWTQEQAAEALGMGRPTVANFVRLLELPPEIQDAVSRNTLSMGHARALAGLGNRAQMVRLVQRIVNEDLSVRSLEKIVATESRSAKKTTPAPRSKKEAHIEDLERQLTQALGTKVELRTRGSAGEIVISYYSAEQLTGLLQKIKA